MTIDCGHPLDAIGFAVEYAKQLGLTPDDLMGNAFRDSYACDRAVLIVHRRPGQKPHWLVFKPEEKAARALGIILSPGGTP